MRWCRIVAALLMFVALPAMADATNAAVGVVTEASGNVRILRADAYYQAAQGVNVTSRDIIETPSGGSAQLEMNDGSILRLGPDSRLALSEYRLDGSGNVVSAALDVISGWLQFQVAKLHQNAAFHFDTTVMTIGIRGTEGTIDARNSQGGLYLEEGAVKVRTQESAGVGPQSSEIHTGQYIGRARGQMFVRADGMPATFRDHLPAALRERLVRRIQFLRQRGIPPRIIRRMRRREAERFLRRHPYMRRQMRQEFRQRFRTNARLRGGVIERERRIQRHRFR